VVRYLIIATGFNKTPGSSFCEFRKPKACDSRFYCFLSDYRARIFDAVQLGLVFSEDPVSGSDFTNRRKSLALILKHGTRRLGESRISPFYTPNIALGRVETQQR